MEISKQFKEKDGKINKTKTITVKIDIPFDEWGVFDITSEISWRGNRMEVGEEYIRKHFGDQFDDVIALKRSSSDGFPDNAYGIMSFNPFSINYYAQIVSKQFRISIEEAKELVSLTKDQMLLWVENHKPIWKQEADEVKKKYNI